MTEAGWTAEPKEEGWHWWRKPSDGLTIPYVVKVQKASSGWFVLWQHDWNYAEVLGGEFLGPLSPTDRQQGRVEGLREAEKYALRCLKELQDKIRDLESGKCVLAGAQTKEGVEAWVHAKTLEASRIAKWITARIIEQQAQDEKGVGHANG